MREFGADDLCVVIPTRNRWPILTQTLGALERQTISGFETVVVVDGTDQRTPHLGAVRIVTKEQGGPGAARNVGTRSTECPLVLFLGDDMIPTARLVECHLAMHNRHVDPEVAVLGCVDLHPRVERNRLNRWMDWSGTQFDYHNIAGPEAGFGRFYSCNVSLKRQFFMAAEGFDEDFTYYYEDLDCGWRLYQKGLRLLYEPQAIAHHLHALEWEDLIRRFQGVARGERLMAAKHTWFEPWFAERVNRAMRRRRLRRIWPLVVDGVPHRFSRLRRAAMSRADAWYYQNLGSYFLDAWEGARDLEELREYLGDRYDQQRLLDHAGGVMRELADVGDEDAFYRSSHAYLYDLTAFALSGLKVPYHDQLRRLVPPPANLLDWGCGIGSDGLRFLEGGYGVEFADFDNPSTRYLRWRLERRGLTSSIYNIDRDDVPDGFDVAYAFDVIEHVDEPFRFLAELERRARLVIVNLLEDEVGGAHPHRSLPIAAILDHAARRGIESYRLYHGRSHLVAYRGAAAPFALRARLRSVLQRRIGPSIYAVQRIAGPDHSSGR